MIRGLSLLLVVYASSATAAERSNALQAWFPDGTGLEIFAESTGNTPVSAPKGEAGGTYIQAERVDKIFRLVGDKDNNALFGYFLEAYRNTQTDSTVIRVLPLDQKTASELLRPPNAEFKSATGRIPTVSTVREFQPVKIGEAATLDILQNPATGEKVYDVLRPIAGPSPSPNSMSVTAVPKPVQLSLKDITLRVNGKAVPAPAAWMLGAAARIDIPGHGAYVLSINEPKDTGYKFYPNVRAEVKSLKWSIDGDQIEIVSKADVGDGVLWVYHESKFSPKEQVDLVRLQAADTVDWLLPKKTEKALSDH